MSIRSSRSGGGWFSSSTSFGMILMTILGLGCYDYGVLSFQGQQLYPLQRQRTIPHSTSTCLYGFSFDERGGWKSIVPNKNATTNTNTPPKVYSRNQIPVPPPQQEQQQPVWDRVKSVVYRATDVVQQQLPRSNAEDYEATTIQESYSNREAAVFSSSLSSSSSSSSTSMTPGQRLLQEYQAKVQAPPPQPIVSKAASFFTSNKDDNDDEKQINKTKKKKKKDNPPPPMSASTSGSLSSWDTFKLGVYGTVDFASSLFGSKNDNSDNEEDATNNSYSTVTNTFQPLVQPNVARSKSVRGNTNNNKQRTSSLSQQWTIEDWEQQQQKYKRKLQREQSAQQFKQTIYRLGDSVVETLETLATVPNQVSQTWSTSQRVVTQDIPQRVTSTITNLQAIPSQIQQTQTKLQTTVNTTLATTNQVVSEVTQFPNKVVTSVETTKQKIKDTQQRLEDTTRKAKVFLKLEKPIPQPPKEPPPPPKTTQDLLLELSTDLAMASMKAAWFVTKGTAVTTAKGISYVVQKGLLEKQQENKAPSKEVSLPAPKEPTTPKPPTPPPILETTKDETTSQQQQQRERTKIDDEVEEALRLAEEALQMAEESSYSRRSSITKEEKEPKEDDTKPSSSSSSKNKNNKLSMQSSSNINYNDKNPLQWFTGRWQDTW